MITLTAPVAPSLLVRQPQPQPSSASVVVIADVGRLLRHPGSLAEVRPAFDALTRCETHVVLCVEEDADAVIGIQRGLGLRQPFICRRGAAVHIPRGFFCAPQAEDAQSDWEVIDFGTPRLAHAVGLIAALYRAAGTMPLIVGIGEEWRDRALLRVVDAPVIVRNSAIDQTRLIQNVPTAYVTEAQGANGWIEAILGHCSVGDA